MTWSIEDYCAEQQATLDDWSILPSTTQAFLQELALPALHPFCTAFVDDWDAYYLEDVPRQGPLHGSLHESFLETIVTIMTMALPSLAAMGELWLRLFASALAPLGIVTLLHQLLLHSPSNNKDNNRVSFLIHRNHSFICILTVAASVVLLTDTLYVLNFGPHFGSSCLTVGTLLSLLMCRRHKLTYKTSFLILGLVALAVFLTYDPAASVPGGLPLKFGDPVDHVDIAEGLYYNSYNSRLKEIVAAWSPDDYSYSTQATPWVSRTIQFVCCG